MSLFRRFDASAFKVHLKTAIARMQLQRNKQTNLVKIQRREIAGLLDRGKDESARIKVEHVIREDFYMEALEILELFCELLLARVPHINSTKELPTELTEAVSTLMYASYRIDIKELEDVRKDLTIKYGEDLATHAQQNTDGSVNPRVINKLSTAPPEQFLVLQYLREIAKEHKIDWQGGDWQADLSLSLPLPPAGRGLVMPPADPRMQMLQPPPYPGLPPSLPMPTAGSGSGSGSAGGGGRGATSGSGGVGLIPGEYGALPPAPPGPLPEYAGISALPALVPSLPTMPMPPSLSEYSAPPASQSIPTLPGGPGLPPELHAGIGAPAAGGAAGAIGSDSSPLAPAMHYAASGSGADSGAPDFDELTRRFEALKKR